MPMFKQWVLSKDAPVLTSKGHHSLTERDFELLEDHTSDLCKGEILCRALFLSVDPITRLYLSYGIGPGETLPGRQVARVVESRNKNFPKGKVCTYHLVLKFYFLRYLQIREYVYSFRAIADRE